MLKNIVFIFLIVFSLLGIYTSSSFAQQEEPETELTTQTDQSEWPAQNYLVIFGGLSAIFSGITALIIWRKMGDSNKLTEKSLALTKESNDIIHMEIFHKLKPKIVVEYPKIKFEDNKMKIECNLSNSGTVVAKNFRCGYFHRVIPTSLQSVLLLEENIDYLGSLSSDAFTEGHAYDIKEDLEYKKEIPKNHYLIFHLWYEFLEDQKYEEIVIVRFEEDKYKGVQKFDLLQIEKIRIEIEENKDP